MPQAESRVQLAAERAHPEAMGAKSPWEHRSRLPDGFALLFPSLLGRELGAGMCHNTFRQLFVFRGCFLLAEHLEHAAPKASREKGA